MLGAKKVRYTALWNFVSSSVEASAASITSTPLMSAAHDARAAAAADDTLAFEGSCTASVASACSALIQEMAAVRRTVVPHGTRMRAPRLCEPLAALAVGARSPLPSHSLQTSKRASPREVRVPWK